MGTFGQDVSILDAMIAMKERATNVALPASKG
jgi:hypothetical protein